MDLKIKEKYFLSATEQEAFHGIFNCQKDVSCKKIENVFAYFKSFSDDEDSRLLNLKIR